MADFHEVHRELLERQMAKFAPRKGDYFCIALLEIYRKTPARYPAPLFDQDQARIRTAVFRRLDADGKYEPANEDGRLAVEAWQVRHIETPAEAFKVPEPWGDRFGPIDDA